MKKLLLILLCLPMIGFGQQTYVPDDNFEDYLEANGMGNGISNDDYVTTASIDTVTFLNVGGMNISDLTGIEAFTDLTFLNCQANQLTSLNVSANTALTFLACSSNQLTSFDVSLNTALTQLRCGYNQLTSLDVSQNTSLTQLWGSNNQLTSLDVSNNTALEYLWSHNNPLTNLDVSQNTALYSLQCNSNQLTNLDVSQNTALYILGCWNNGLTNLDLSQNTALEILYSHNNQLTSLDVSQNTALYSLKCFSNQLTNLDVSQNTALEYLYCASNQLTTLDVSNNLDLITLSCGSNQLTNLDLRNGNNTVMDTNFICTNNPNLYCIDVDDVAWADTNWTVANGNIDSTMSFSTNCAIALGCTDSLACNYDALATIYDSSCFYSWSGIYVNISSVCDSLIIGNMVFYSIGAGVYADTIPISNGCDSIVIYTFDINQSTSSYDTLSANSAFVWNGNTLNLSGDYSDTLINSVGCDSIANLNLTITNTTGLLDVTNTEKTLLKITDMLGQETPYRRNTPLFYIYDDGTVEKRIVIE